MPPKTRHKGTTSLKDPVEPWECRICKEMHGNPLDKVMECERCREHYYMCQTTVIWRSTACCPSVKQLIREEQESGTDHSTKKLRADLDTTMYNMKNKMTDVFKFIAGTPHGKGDEQT